MKPKIAIFQHHPEASRESCEGIVKALSDYYRVVLFSKEDCSLQLFDGIDLIAFPGGIGEADIYYKFFRRKIANDIAKYVADGGAYLGICMGAYWAGSRYFDILDGVDSNQYIKRPRSGILRSYGTIAPVKWNGVKEKMYFHDGAAFFGDTEKFKTVAIYKNGDAMAIIQNRIGLIGCHPESMKFWYDKLFLKEHWHKGKHNKLLLEFVDSFIKN